ncbi:MAG: dethiobiotin synthase [Coxiella sp. (in: Bacteria)]|nr:MAG: dethiobiotin synthase [Coxiella sp. (in: g-proteobacteria)]
MRSKAKEILFVSGTDTDCGKTYCTVNLLNSLRAQGKSVLGLKPIASGCTQTTGGLRNDDALLLQEASSFTLPYEHINPFAFREPIAPHIAAANGDQHITVQGVIDALQPALQTSCDTILIEGAGGLMAPLNQTECIIDLIDALHVPLIFIIGLKLGCLNQSLLSFHMLNYYQIEVKQVIINPIDPNMSHATQNIEYLNDAIKQLSTTRIPV